jgi:hypothetical protein
VDERRPSELIPFEDARAQVALDWAEARRRESMEARLKDIAGRYRVERPE